jgi:hypothetical protein
MDYTVQFIGLTHFAARTGSKLALLPDGRNPAPDIDVHQGSIVVYTADIIQAQTTGWQGYEISTNVSAGTTEYFFQPSVITFPTTGTSGTLDSSGLDADLIRLVDLDKRFVLSNQPETIATAELNAGKIVGFFVGATNAGYAQLIAEWTVPSDENPFVITVANQRGFPVRTLALQKGAYITLSNSCGASTKPGDHFAIYEQLSGTEVTIRTPTGGQVWSSQPFANKSPFFFAPRPASGDVSCSPTG